jgi:two-component system response regulator FixJ
MTAPAVLVVEDDPAARDSLVRLLQAEGHAVVAFGTAEALLAHPGLRGARCILADLRLGDGMSGEELLVALKAARVPVPVVMLTAHADIPMAVRAMRAGAREFLEKPVPPEALLAAVAAALAEAPAPAEAASRLARLTPREREVLAALVAGASNKEAGLRLGISPRTVETYRAAVMDKLGVRSFAELVRVALAAGLVD